MTTDKGFPLYCFCIMVWVILCGFPDLSAQTDSPQALKDQSQAVWDLLNANQLGKASDAMDRFLADNLTPEVVPLARDLGWGFSSKFRDFGKAIKIYQFLIDKYPDDPRIVFVIGSKVKAMMDQGMMDQALAAAEPLYAGRYVAFEKQFEAAAWIAWEFQQAEQYPQAADLFGRLIAAHPDDPRACKARADRLWTLLQTSPPDQAKALINEIFAKCADPAAIKSIEDCAWVVRQKHKDYPTALEMYFRLINRFPNAPNVVQVRRCIVETYIEMGAKEVALAEAAAFERDFSGHPQEMWAFAVGVAAGIRLEDEAVRANALEKFLRQTGHPEFVAAFQYIEEQYIDRTQKAGRQPTAEECRAPIEIYEKVMAAAPNLEPTVQTQGFIAMCYQWSGRPDKATALYNKLVLREPRAADRKTRIAFAGDRFCGAYCIWHLLRHYGTTVPIDDIIGQMGIRNKGFSTIQDIVDYLADRNIPAQPMHVAAENLTKIDTPFVQYRIPRAGSDLGHFVLCIPTGNGKAVVLDGANDPVLIDLGSFTDKDASWDGTIILIQKSRSDFLSQVITERMNWKTAVALAECWYAADNPDECMSQARSYFASIADQKLANLKGGCDWDCVLNGQRCNTLRTCTSDANCSLGTSVCASEVLGSMCMIGYGGLLPCYDGTHECKKLSTETGNCDEDTNQCAIQKGSNACGSTVKRCSGLIW
ncbi:MAG: hypothetical protein GX455_09355 [Phycisphaerae bacterium]|nr:hypothetical protein [Phycisphaerae bacterium]